MTKGGGRPNVPIGMEFAENPELDAVAIGTNQIKSAYRMHLAGHMGGTNNCKRNCRFNPRCLSCLGERSWLDAQEEEEDEEEEESEMEDEMVRMDGVPAGLRNLGNTCYVNSFLQIWFHNSKFREALYEWEAGEDPEEKDNESILELEYEPRSKVASLQALFAMMQFTKRKFVDPADFIVKLGLNPSVQQDAQEFSKLFVSLLEKSLAHQRQEKVRTMIEKQFRGEYAYVTTCQACHRESVRPSHFYELDLHLAGNKTLGHCLADFLKVERMIGDEKYFCEGCETKQEATRCCKLTELPPVLNLQLNRFQYDMQLGRKKKLNSNIQFPEQLDMTGYLGKDPDNPVVYVLTGVLMHLGPDANHGHYIAHIQELETGAWFKFSDETVTPLQGKHLRLGNDNDEMQGKKGGKYAKAQTGKSGVQNSNNAYMLVYMVKESLQEIRTLEKVEKMKRDIVTKTYLSTMRCQQTGEPGEKRRKVAETTDFSSEYCYSNCRVFPRNFPPHLRTKIDRDNMEFDEEHEERMTTRLAEQHATRTKRQRMIAQYLGLRWEPGLGEEDWQDCSEEQDSFEFMPTSWLMMWLANPTSCGPVETRHYLCLHDNLDVDKLVEVKLCNARVVSKLYTEFGEGEGPRLNHNKLCRICVTNKARLISLDYKMMRDQEFLSTQKFPSDGTGFWVGKRSYQRWRTLAKVSLEDKIILEVTAWKEEKEKKRQKLLGARLKLKEDQVSKEKETKEPGFCLTILQAKLQKMGTNVSIAPQDLNGRGGLAGSQTGLSVIRNGEAFKLANIAEVKLNLTKDEERKSWQNKPSCVVKPMIKAPKPSATVKPFVKSEGISEAVGDYKVQMDNKLGQDSVSDTTPSSRLETVKSIQIHSSGDSEPTINGCNTPKAITEGSGSQSTRSSRSSSTDSSDVKTENSDSSSRDPSGPDAGDPSPTLSDAGLPSGTPTSVKTIRAVTPVPSAPILAHEDDFNSDILCPHGNLTIQQRHRQLVSRAAWHTLAPYFVRPITFQFGSQLCSTCEEELNAANLQKDRWREEAARQKSRLPDLFGDKERPQWSKPSTTRVYLLSSSFVLAWRGFVRGLSAGKAEVGESITDVNNKMLICDHDGLLYPPTIGWETEPESALVMVTEEEWHTVQDMFNVDIEIRVDRENESGLPVLRSHPAPCSICVASRREAEQEDRLKYTNSLVFVRRISPDEKLPDQDAQDPEYYTSQVFGEGGAKRAKLGSDFVRRSNRRVKVRGEREFTVHSDMLLRDFKVKLMEVFKVAPYDQNLMVNGEYLTENHLSLGQLKVLPGSLIFLRADEPALCAPSHSEDYMVGQHPEQGFKGTGLLSG